MNLRNVAWHGFFDLEDFHPCCVDFLLVLVASLGDVLGNRWIKGTPIEGQQPDFLKAFIEWEKKIQIVTPMEVKEKHKKIRGNWGQVREVIYLRVFHFNFIMLFQASRSLDRMAEKYDKHLVGWGPHDVIFKGGRQMNTFPSFAPSSS